MKVTKVEAEHELYKALLELNTVEEFACFFHDLCTPAELAAMSERWRVAQLLDQQPLSYREIYNKTGVSLATIGRVARFLTQEAYQGYRLVLDRLKDKLNK
jgi:TrpR-related protein YerC/YecD